MPKKHLIILFLSFLACQVSFAIQRPIRDTIILPHNISRFIPKGYALLDTAMGDLNLDNYKDIILVLKTIGEDTALDATEYKRPLLLLLGHVDKNFTVVARNDNIVRCHQCGGVFGEPYDTASKSKKDNLLFITLAAQMIDGRMILPSNILQLIRPGICIK
jgi:hypothetical protein